MPTHENLAVAYHQQDTDYYCGAACAQMVLDSLGAGLLDQNVLYNDNHSHSTTESGWYTAPDGLQWTMHNLEPPAPPGPPHYGSYDFVLFALDTEDLISRKIVWTIHNYKAAPIAMVFGSAHWIVVRGYTASAAPADYSDTSYSIDSFDVNNPEPPTPGGSNPSLAPPPPHTDGTDGCGSGGSRGLANENISYSTWQSTYMTGIPGGYWGGKFVAVADPAPPPALRGVPSRPLMKPLEYRGELLRAAQATARAEESLKAYGLATRENYSRALDRAKFGEGVLVQRLDLPDTFYWIVPATEGSFNTLAVAVDAKSGLYMQSAVHANPEGNLLQFGSTEEVAKSIIGKVVELPNGGVRIPVRREALCQYPRLVWMPCRESLSPFYPFHMFTIGSERIYVRTDGAIFTSLRTGDRGI
ncbi:MAG TPA: hypothetical protein VH117_13275 [Edaphobacter sp.]|jgi:hypothetical protein|nr:hypothetical protein [Edaphobacter sp.]